MSGLKILSIGPGATVQDRGRAGWQSFGVWEGGALDAFALAEGQALLGNGADDAALELIGLGGRFRAEGPLVLATSGAEMALTVDGRPHPWRASFAVATGTVIEIGAVREGVVGYLHVAGGFRTARHMDSRATHAGARLGTVPEAGLVLPADPAAQRPERGGWRLPRPKYFDTRSLRFLRGVQTHLFSDETVAGFLAARLTVTPRRDRMGMRIASDHGPITSTVGQSVLSDATVLGDIQATADGTPAILLADRGPTGGYPRIGTIAQADLPALVQMPPGTSFTLREVSVGQARAALIAELRARRRLADARAALTRQPTVEELLGANLISGAVRGDEWDG